MKIDSNLQAPIETLGDQNKHDKMVKEQAKAQEEARVTVTDATDRVPQWDGAGYGAINTKGPEMHVHSPRETEVISLGHPTGTTPTEIGTVPKPTGAQSKRGSGGKMGKEWN